MNMKEKFSRNLLSAAGFLLLLTLAAVVLPGFSAKAAGIDNIRARAHQLCEIEWTPWKDVLVHSYNEDEGNDWAYEAGETYYGIPYGQVPGEGYYVTFEASLDDFLAAVADPNSDFYTKRAKYGSQRSPWYAMDCSAFVSYCIGSPRYPTSYIGSLTYDVSDTSNELASKKNAFARLAYIPEYDVRAFLTPEDDAWWYYYNYEENKAETVDYDHTWESLIEPGDCVNMPGYHVALIMDVSRDEDGKLLTVTVAETMEPVPGIYETSAANFASRFAEYQLVRYNAKDDCPPPVAYTPRETGRKEGWPVAVFNEKARSGANAMYRLYYPGTHEHLYTADRYEAKTLCTPERGWYFEGVSWYAPKTGDPVYRLFNPATTDHHYTMDYNEYMILGSQGWNQEGIGWYSDPAKGIGMHRLFTKELVVGAHHYTSDENEYKTLMATGSWIDEKYGWYGLK